MTSPAASAPAQGYLAEQPALRWNGARPLLTVFDIELTERCNNNCIHCCINLPERDRSARKRELSTEAVEELLRQGAELGALTVRFSGGEPLLRDDFTELYLYARRLGLRVMLFTNARLITPELAGLFARIPPREPVEITVYGMSADSCAAVTRSRGAFAEFRRGVDLLIRHRIPFFLKGTMLPETRSELEQLLSWSQSIPGMKELPSFVLFLELRHRRDSEARNRQIEKLRLSPGKPSRFWPETPMYTRPICTVSADMLPANPPTCSLPATPATRSVSTPTAKSSTAWPCAIPARSSTAASIRWNSPCANFSRSCGKCERPIRILSTAAPAACCAAYANSARPSRGSNMAFSINQWNTAARRRTNRRAIWAY